MWPLSYFVGLGLSWGVLDGANTLDQSAAVDAAVTAPVYPDVGVGLQVRGSHVTGWTGDPGGPRSMSTLHSLSTYDIAATAHLSGGRILFAPWAGLHLIRGVATTYYGFYDPDPTPGPMTVDVGIHTTVMVGALLSVDLLQSPPHAVAIYAELERSMSDRAGDATTEPFAATLGIAYRYR